MTAHQMPSDSHSRSKSEVSIFLTAAAVFATAIGYPCHAQPTGVTGYEAIELEYDAFRLDEFARVLGDTEGLDREIIVWVNGEYIFFPTPDGYMYSFAGNISPTSGIIVGGVYQTGIPDPPIVWNLETQEFTLLDMPPGSGTSTGCKGHSVTDLGVILFDCYWPTITGLYVRHMDPFLVEIEGSYSGAFRINEYYEMLGWEGTSPDTRWYILSPQPTFPFTWEWHEIMIGEGSDVGPTGFNNNREIVGEYEVRSSFYWYDDVLTVLPEPHPCGYGYDAGVINDFGLLAGNGGDSDCGWNYRAAVWERITPLGQVPPEFNTYTIIDYMPRQPDININGVNDINNSGQMVTYGENELSEVTYYLVTPYLFNLSDPTPGIAGQCNTATVTNLEPFQKVHLAYGTLPGAQRIGNNCLGGLILIRDAQTHPSFTAIADETGTAVFEIYVSPKASGRTVRYQVIAPGECDISHTVEFTFE